MTNIVLLHEGEFPTVEETYRSFQYLVKRYGVFLNKINSNSVKAEQLIKSDIVICIRGHSPITYYILHEAKELGKKIYFLLDDDLKDMPKGSFWYPERKKWLLKCLSMCDVLLTTNKLIAEEYEKYIAGKKTVIINTAVDSKTILPYRKNGETVKIVMSASDWHTANFIKYVKKAAIKISQEYGNKVEWYFIGLHPDMKELEGISKVSYIPSMKMSDYVKYMQNNRFDIGIAVLNPDHFNERKYFNKFIEYTRYGICGIYSNCMPFRLVVNKRKNGIVSENTDDGWYHAFKILIDDPALRISCVSHAQSYLKKKHSETYLFNKLIEDCPDLIQYHSDKSKRPLGLRKIYWKIRQVVFRVTESAYLTVSSLIHFGSKETLYRIKRKIIH